jgi:site-specific DNA-cytosine methylase
MAQQLIDKKQVDTDVQEFHHMHVSRRGKRVHRVLVLCSGTGHDAKEIKQLYPSAKIDTMDINAKHEPTTHQDILTWAYRWYPRGHYDIICASPQCTAFSKANPFLNGSAVFHATRMVATCFEVINYFQPYVWILEIQ